MSVFASSNIPKRPMLTQEVTPSSVACALGLILGYLGSLGAAKVSTVGGNQAAAKYHSKKQPNPKNPKADHNKGRVYLYIWVNYYNS